MQFRSDAGRGDDDASSVADCGIAVNGETPVAEGLSAQTSETPGI